MPRKPPPKIHPDLLERILRTLIWKVGIKSLAKPSKALTKQIEEGWKRFLWDVSVRAARGPLDELAGLASVEDLRDSIPFELPDLRKSKPVPSRIKLRTEYNKAFRQAKIAFQAEGARSRNGVRIDTPLAALVAKFPDIPRDRFKECKTASDAAIQVVKRRCADHISPATLGRLVSSRSKSWLATLDHERRAADFDPDLIAAIRVALAQHDTRKKFLDSLK